MNTKPICKTYANGDKFWYLNDKLHREDGPAIEYANGDKCWYLNDKRHREDGPAVEYANGTKSWYLNGKCHREDEFNKAMKTKQHHPTKTKTKPICKTDEDGNKRWYLNGKLHREDGPACEYPNESKSWYLNGKLHREDGPAMELANGTKYWYLNDKLHKEDGPACEYSDGDKYWYLNGKLHRADGPAIEWANGDKCWYLNGKELTEDEFNKAMKTKPTKIPLEENYWVIDTASAGALSGEFSSRGPYPTQEAAERAIIECTKELWEDSCVCLQRDKRTDWCSPLHIVKVIRTVQPKVTANVKLETV
jgi:hypothetical protein